MLYMGEWRECPYDVALANAMLACVGDAGVVEVRRITCHWTPWADPGTPIDEMWEKPQAVWRLEFFDYGPRGQARPTLGCVEAEPVGYLPDEDEDDPHDYYWCFIDDDGTAIVSKNDERNAARIRDREAAEIALWTKNAQRWLDEETAAEAASAGSA